MPGVREEVHDSEENNLARLKTHSGMVERIMWLIALGMNASALEEEFRVREITIRSWL